MTQNRTRLILQRIGLLALLAAVLAGCGKEAPPPPPPPPPPFQSQAVEVELGEHGGSITLMTTQQGGYTRNGQPFQTGAEVEAENGNKYKLTLGDDGWSAEFLPPEALMVALGASGDTVSITRVEDRSYLVDEMPLADDGEVEAENGNKYKLTLGEDGWSAEFVQPEGSPVALGASGEAVLITQAEDRSYLADGQALADDGVVEASNGNRYRLTLGEDGWSAEFVPTYFQVPLGRSGGSVTLRREEDGQYWLDSVLIEDRKTVDGPNNSKYVLTLQDGEWTAAYRPDTVQVPAGESGEILDLVRLEDGTYSYRGKPIEHGETVEAENGNSYTLTRDPETGAWQAVFNAGTIRVPLGGSGDSVELTKREDGTYARSGRTFRSGSLVEASNGVNYQLTLTEDGWTARAHSVVEPDPGDGGGGTSTKRSDNLESVQSLPTGREPTFRTSDGDPDPDEGTTLVVRGTSDATPQEYELQDLLRRGLVTRTRTYVEEARQEIKEIRDAIYNRRQIYDLEGLDPHEDIAGQDGYWAQVQTALASVFGDAAKANNFLGKLPTGRRDETLDADEVDDVIEALDEVLDSLSTLSKFEDDIFDQLITDASVEEVFEAPISKIQFGSSSNTRFAAYGVQHDGGSAVAPESWDVGAFAYSPLEVSNRTKVPNRGEASFQGDTVAVLETTGTPKFYSGDIELTARFSTGRVLGLITNLRDEDNDLWSYKGDEVESIRLPIAELGSGDAAFSVDGAGTADLRFVPGSQPTSTFQGKFVGDDKDEADAVIGTWDINVDGQDKLTGAFGAEYRTTKRAEKPELEESPRGSRSETFIEKDLDEPDGHIDLGSFEDLDASRLYSDRDGRSVFDSTDETLELTVEYRHTDYTRYGVWVQRRTVDDSESFDSKGFFAYSPLRSTEFTIERDSDYVYPKNVTAVYSGQTIALDKAADADPETYTGSIELTVYWKGSYSDAALEAVIRDLRSLKDRDWFAVGGEDVDRIVLTGSVPLTSATDPSFRSSPSFEVWYRDPHLTRSSESGSHNGKFVGMTLDGPVGVIGNWVISTISGRSIEGVYGAELQP